MDRPYLYSACRELGVVTFDITDADAPFPTDTILPASLSFLRPTNLVQYENYLFVSLGGFDGFFPQNPGLAIIDIANPELPVIKDVWFDAMYNQGCAIVITDGTYAYLGAMDEGVIIVDVSNVNDIQFVSNILPDIEFPDVPGLFSTPNARGLYKLNEETLLVANDHGGLRWIDISNIEEPVETGKYMNDELYAIAAPAYNNIAVKDHYAYVSVDYCGLDVIDVGDSEMETVLWINPWDCDTSNWIGRAGHTNEVVIKDDLLFLSGGDSEVLVYDISTPAIPVLVGQFAFPFDSVVAWSVDVNDSYVSLALVNNSVFGIPYYSNTGGIKILDYNVVTTIDENDVTIKILPNPVSDKLFIQFTASSQAFIAVVDMLGNIVFEKVLSGESSLSIDFESFAIGIYQLQCFNTEGYTTQYAIVKL
ncbi:MAG: T9SS type A sorting domain-containing protein [Chitinophagales bacterium]